MSRVNRESGLAVGIQNHWVDQTSSLCVRWAWQSWIEIWTLALPPPSQPNLLGMSWIWLHFQLAFHQQRFFLFPFLFLVSILLSFFLSCATSIANFIFAGQKIAIFRPSTARLSDVCLDSKHGQFFCFIFVHPVSIVGLQGLKQMCSQGQMVFFSSAPVPTDRVWVMKIAHWLGFSLLLSLTRSVMHYSWPKSQGLASIFPASRQNK